jgi:hypothetical protein
LQDSVQAKHYFQISIMIGVLTIFLAPLFQGKKKMQWLEILPSTQRSRVLIVFPKISFFFIDR